MNVRINRGAVGSISHSRRLHHLREIARQLGRVAQSSTLTQSSKSAASHNLETINWAIDYIEAHPPSEDGK